MCCYSSTARIGPTRASRCRSCYRRSSQLAPEELEKKAIYNAFELSCALKPHLFRLLLDRSASAIVFTDTDTFFYAPVTDLADRAAMVGLALIPHEARPPAPVRSYVPLAHVEYRRFVGGLFNLGFIAVGQGGEAFLDWWGARLARDRLTEPAAGMYVDERWVDWVPVTSTTWSSETARSPLHSGTSTSAN